MMTYDVYIEGFGSIESINVDSEEEAQDIGWEIAKEWLAGHYDIIKEFDEEEEEE